jgi:hypothetical protein
MKNDEYKRTSVLLPLAIVPSAPRAALSVRHS